MNINGINAMQYQKMYEAKRKKGNNEKGFGSMLPKEAAETEEIESSDMATKNTEETEGVQKSQTKTDIIVRPDGSRVLVVTTTIGGMQTNMSLKISDATDMPNENERDNADDGQLASERIAADRLASGRSHAAIGEWRGNILAGGK